MKETKIRLKLGKKQEIQLTIKNKKKLLKWTTTNIIIPTAIILIIISNTIEIRKIGQNTPTNELENIDEKIITPAITTIIMTLTLIINELLNEKYGEKNIITIKTKYEKITKWVKNKTW